MSNPFKAVAHGIEVGVVDTVKGVEWLGKEIVQGLEYLPKLITVTQDAEETAKNLVPEIGVLVTDVKNIVVTAGSDGLQFLDATKALWASILAAVQAGGTNVALDLSLIPQVQAAIVQGKTFENEIPLFEKLFTDGKSLLSTVEAGLAKIEADLGA